MTNKETELLGVYKQVQDLNKNVYGLCLGGSLMLAVRGLTKRRPAKDIDIILYDYGMMNDLVLPEGFKLVETKERARYVDCIQYTYLGIKIDFLECGVSLDTVDGIKCASVESLIIAKASYLAAKLSDDVRTKHARDLINLFACNDVTFVAKNNTDDLPF